MLVSRRTFICWWFVFLGVHLVTCCYNGAYAFFYWTFNTTETSWYLAFYHVGMPPDYYGIIGIVHILMASVHGVCILLMVGGSLWLRNFVFTPWGEYNDAKFRKILNGCTMQAKITEFRVKRVSVSAKVRKSLSMVTAEVTNRYGFLGVNGKYFHWITASRELVETTLQTIQAYRMSRLLPSLCLDRFYVVALVLNCWSSAVIYASCYRGSESRKRFTSLACDCTLDLISSMGVTFIVVLSYVGQYDPDTTDFGGNPWYNDEWTARALNEFQIVLIVSWSDLASRVPYNTDPVLHM
ncbi:unnamed protein product [Phytophthora fragariaefolia]|uniref:Unnamed protein product n=1 Tax=Phytophthora fragariaefolia TaxID=1490495 RepID=A0A9W6YD32_9STRA|nr:unnamed protein product [Phytophthora fragariaefolia]